MTGWYVCFLLIVALIIYALTEYAVRRDRRELNEWKEKNNLPF
jgi:hypothetical protein